MENGAICIKFGESVSMDEATKFVSADACGAISIFVGVTRRDEAEKGTVVGLEFEAHVPLGTAVMKDIVEEYIAREPRVMKVYMSHRIGYVAVGDTNVILAVSSGHRDVSMRAIEDLMNSLKAQLPVWKKEVFDSGEYVWKTNKESSLASN
jgi:molybdopterin synthase catalytic subunit